MTRAQRWLVGGSALLILGLVGWMGLFRLRPPVFHGVLLQSPKPAADFTLTAHTGQRVHLSAFRGKLVLLFFGYTFCPDVCPVTLAKVAQALKRLGPKARQVQVLFISVDPDRDTLERLAAYVTSFDPTFIGMTGTPEEIASVAARYGIFFKKEEGTKATGYLVAHTAIVTVIDPQGDVRLLFPFGISPDEMADDLASLLCSGGGLWCRFSKGWG